MFAVRFKTSQMFGMFRRTETETHHAEIKSRKPLFRYPCCFHHILFYVLSQVLRICILDSSEGFVTRWTVSLGLMNTGCSA